MLSLLLLLAACKTAPVEDTGPPPWRPDLVCPGDDGCSTAEGSLHAGAATVSILPSCMETWTDSDGDATYRYGADAFHDCGCDDLCAEDPGYPGPDEGEGDGRFQGVWMAGFHNSRPASGVRGPGLGLEGVGDGDGLWARALVLRQGETSVGIVTLDVVGWLYEPGTQRIRELAAGLELDLVVVHATHNHEGPDTMGIWGPSIVTSGAQPAYLEQVAQAAADALSQANASAQPVTEMVVGTVDSTPYSERGTRGIVNDTRDPYVVDERVGGARLVGADGQTIAALVSFGNHPEALSDGNTQLSSDFVHATRKGVEAGLHFTSHDRDGVGGTALFLNSTVGGMMTPLRVGFVDYDGVEHSASSFAKADTVGARIADIALDAMSSRGQSVAAPALSLRTTSLRLPVENIGFQAMFLLKTIDRPLYDYDPDQPLDDQNIPFVHTELDVVQVGPLRLLTIPGELLPENLVGGYDGSHVNAPGVSVVRDDNPNPPDLAAAPAPPYLLDHFGTEHAWVIGLGNDELGYIIPPYNFELDLNSPYLSEAEGDHYEETNSLGPQTAPLVLDAARALLEWSP